jgi:hypothetical protein
MLSFRMILFCGLAGICLWGLFDLLDNLKQPELLRSPKAIVVKGCDPAPDDAAGKLCPQLYCQKAILDAKVVPLRSRFSVTIDKTHAGPPGTHLVAGLARLGDGGEQPFACLLDRHKVMASNAITPQQLEELAQQSGDWKL